MIKRTKADICFDILNHIFMIFLMFICLYPFLYVVFASFSDSNALTVHEGLLLWPLKANLASYKAVFKNPSLITGYKNTIFILVFGLALNMSATIACAYVLSRKEFGIRKFATTFVMIPMFFSGGLVPLYLTVKQVGLDGTLWALIVPGCLSIYNMIIMRTGFLSVPESLVESAKIDGARHLRILVKIIIPLSLPTIAVIALYYAVGHWNSWFAAMIYLRDRELYPLQLVLREILLENNTDSMTMTMSDLNEQNSQSISETIQFAIIVVSTIPILAIYPFIQRYFVKGVMIGAVKG